MPDRAPVTSKPGGATSAAPPFYFGDEQARLALKAAKNSPEAAAVVHAARRGDWPVTIYTQRFGVSGPVAAMHSEKSRPRGAVYAIRGLYSPGSRPEIDVRDAVDAPRTLGHELGHHIHFRAAAKGLNVLVNNQDEAEALADLLAGEPHALKHITSVDRRMELKQIALALLGHDLYRYRIGSEGIADLLNRFLEAERRK